MTANTANRGYTYPQSTDDFRPYEDIQELAQDVDVDVQALADSILAWRPVTAAKAAATNRNTLIVNAADPDLSLSLPAGATYNLNGQLFLSSNANAAGDWRGALTWTGTASVSYSMQGLVTGIASGGSADLIASPATRLDTSSPGLDFLAGCSTQGMLVVLHGRIVCTTAVTLTLAWSQRVSNANNTNLLEGSSLTAYRVA
jgi:hypothetical protein